MKDGLHTSADGSKCWFLNNQLHRTDGPAVELADGIKRWYLNGRELSFAEWLKRYTELFIADEKTDSKAAEEQLESLSPDKLRPILSRLAVKTPGVLYYGLPFKADIAGLSVKTTDDDDKMNPLGQAMMFSASDLLGVGDAINSEISSIQHGGFNYGSFKITVTRISE
jgi:hypothetical protein